MRFSRICLHRFSNVFNGFSFGQVVLYTAVMVFYLPKTLVKTLAKNMVKKLAKNLDKIPTKFVRDIDRKLFVRKLSENYWKITSKPSNKRKNFENRKKKKKNPGAFSKGVF